MRHAGPQKGKLGLRNVCALNGEAASTRADQLPEMSSMRMRDEWRRRRCGRRAICREGHGCMSTVNEARGLRG